MADLSLPRWWPHIVGGGGGGSKLKRVAYKFRMKIK